VCRFNTSTDGRCEIGGADSFIAHEKLISYFENLGMTGIFSNISIHLPFVLSLSKDSGEGFQ